jgi:hypothetical protein
VDGVVEFEGRANVEPLGKLTWRVHPAATRAVRDAFEKARFSTSQAVSTVAELQRGSLTYASNGSAKTLTFEAHAVKDDLGFPPDDPLAVLADDIERIIGVGGFVHRSASEPHVGGGIAERIMDPFITPTLPVPECTPAKPLAVRGADGGVLSGSVLMRYVVTAEGRVEQVRALKPAPAALTAAVEQWLRACRFQPARLADRAVAVKMAQAFNFRE